MTNKKLLKALIVPCYNNGNIEEFCDRLNFDMHNVCVYNYKRSKKCKKCEFFFQKFSILPLDKCNIIIELISTKSKKLALLNINSPIPLIRLATKYALDMNYCELLSFFDRNYESTSLRKKS